MEGRKEGGERNQLFNVSNDSDEALNSFDSLTPASFEKKFVVWWVCATCSKISPSCRGLKTIALHSKLPGDSFVILAS